MKLTAAVQCLPARHAFGAALVVRPWAGVVPAAAGAPGATAPKRVTHLVPSSSSSPSI